MFLRKFVILFVGLVIAASGLVNIISPQDANAATRDCDSNAVIRCGAHSLAELKNKYRTEGRGVKKIFSKFGIRNAKDLNGVVNGQVHKDGRVTVKGKVVATNAMSSGRHFMPGSTKLAGTNAWIRPTHVSFKQSSLPAFVKIENGQFKWAIIKACGNPVKAKAKPVPKFECKDLSAEQVGKPDENTFKFTATAKVKRAKVQKYIFNFGDGNVVRSNKRTVTHTYAQPGNYNAFVRIKTNKGKTQKVNRCAVSIKIAEIPAEVPEVPEVEKPVVITEKPEALPVTGPSAAALGLFGSGALGIGIRNWRRSRKVLFDTLLDR